MHVISANSCTLSGNLSLLVPSETVLPDFVILGLSAEHGAKVGGEEETFPFGI